MFLWHWAPRTTQPRLRKWPFIVELFPRKSSYCCFLGVWKLARQHMCPRDTMRYLPWTGRQWWGTNNAHWSTLHLPYDPGALSAYPSAMTRSLWHTGPCSPSPQKASSDSREQSKATNQNQVPRSQQCPELISEELSTSVAKITGFTKSLWPEGWIRGIWVLLESNSLGLTSSLLAAGCFAGKKLLVFNRKWQAICCLL